MAIGLTSGYEGYAFQHASSVLMTAGALSNAEVYQFRWLKAAGATQRARILGVFLSAAVDATGFTAQSCLFNMTVARGWSVDGAGGTDVTPTAVSNKLRTSNRPSLLVPNGGKIRISSGAALTAGTKTLDSAPVGNIIGSAGAAGSAMVNQIPLYADWESSYGVPLVLDDQEGFVVQATVPATGTWRFGIQTFWAEID
jgi:hypothetical protein